jgi:hypothetical protein
VQVRDRDALEAFRASWSFHHPLTESMLQQAGVSAVVTEVGFYHGGDVLYRLAGSPGTWHEACLKASDD